MSLRLSNGKHHSIGRKLTTNQKTDISLGLLNYYKNIPKKSKPFKISQIRIVFNTSSGIYYEGVHDAVKCTNLDYQKFYRMLIGKIKNKTDFILCNKN